MQNVCHQYGVTQVPLRRRGPTRDDVRTTHVGPRPKPLDQHPHRHGRIEGEDDSWQKFRRLRLDVTELSGSGVDKLCRVADRSSRSS